MKTPATLTALVAGFFVSALPVVSGQTIPNPSFEANTFTVWPGYASGNGGVITGWTFTGYAGLNPAGGNPFADNGAVPDGQNVAFLHSFSNQPSSLSTTISGLVPGVEYRVSFRSNVRAGYSPPAATCSVDGVTIVAPLPSTPVGAVDSTNPYHTVTGIFPAAGATATLTVTSVSATDGTLLLDAFTVARADPVINTANAGAGSLRQALLNAAARPGPDTIRFDAALSGQTISLTGTANQHAIIINDADGVTVDATELPGGITIDDGTAQNYGLFRVQDGSQVTLRGLTFANGGGSSFNGFGGAIHALSNTTLVAERCTFSGNSVNGATLGGGAIFARNVMLTHCTFFGNSATGANTTGGAIAASFGTITNCTFFQNSVAGTNAKGGAIHDSDLLELTHCTVSGNFAAGTSSKGGGIYGASLTLTNTIVAGNFAQTDSNVTGSIDGSSSHNLTSGEPRLSPLANNGGPTKTMALLPGSPALDAGVVLDPVVAVDARGFARNLDSNGDGTAAPDIGAYEAQAAPVAGIGLNLSDSAVTSGDTILDTSTAGAPNLAQAFWNNLPATPANSGGITADTTTRYDADGAAVAGLKLWWKGPNTWRFGGTADTADKKLMFGYLDSSAAGDGTGATDLFNTPAAQPYLAVAGLPAAYTFGGYRVVVYADGDATDGRIGKYWLTSNRAQNPASTGGESVLTGSLFSRDTANFSGTYTRATATTDSGVNTPGGNYMVFDGLTEQGGFIVRAEEGSLPVTVGRAPINAVQILRNEIVAVTTAADELDPFGTPGTGMSLREALRDAPDGAGIVFDAPLAGQYIALSAARGDLVLEKNVTIDASNLAGGVTISRDVTGLFRLFTVLPGKTVTLAGLSLTGGKGGGQNLTTTGGAIQNAGTLSLKNCTLFNNSTAFNGADHTGTGGAIHNDGILTLTGCSFVNNRTARTGAGVSAPIFDDSASGGAIYNPAGKTLTITNCTFTANNSINDGGAIASLGTLTITHSTFAGNFIGGNALGGYGGGIAINGGTLSLAYSIIAGNTAAPNGGNGPDLYRHTPGGGTITPVGKNLIGNPAASGLSAGPAILTGAANLAALGSYGGLTQTMPPLPGSTAIDAATGSTMTTDQRGNARPTDGNGDGSLVADLGAVERKTFVPPVSLAVTTTADSGQGSLREAIANATGEAGETVTFPPVFTGPIVLASGITVPNGKAVVVDAGNVTAGVVLSGGGSSRIFYVSNGGNLTLKGVTLTGGRAVGNDLGGAGGAIHNDGTLTLTQCTFSGNSANLIGGAITNTLKLTMTQCTLSGNYAGIDGGAIHNDGMLTLTQCTLSGNSTGISGGAIFNIGSTFQGGALTLTNTIVAGNTAPNGPDIGGLGGTVTPTGKNLIGNFADSGLSGGANLLTGALNLSPLGNYGGPMQTMLPLPGSAAINPAGGDTASSFTTDQRGSARVVGGIVDIGAVEAGSFVTNTNNAGTGSLRQAVLDAGTGGMVINFLPALNGQTINLLPANGTIVLDKNLEINTGGLPAGITVKGNALAGSGHFRLFSVNGGRTVTMHNVKITNGGGTAFNGFGGAFFVAGTLTLTRCTLSGNKVQAGNSGGAISSNTGSTLSLTDCTLTGNEANSGGAVDTGGIVTLDRCTFAQNKALAGNGGAISASSAASNVALTQCTVTANTATGAGGGIGMFDGTLTLTHCTIAGGNSAGSYGGGVFMQGGGMHIANTIIAGNDAPITRGPDLYESGFIFENFAFTGRVFIGSLEGNGFGADARVLTTAANGAVNLSALGDYGGPTQTMIPLAGSPVRDKASGTAHFGTALNVTFPTDQRGTRRILDSDTVAGAVSDLGAAESGKDAVQDFYLWSQANLPVGTTPAQRAAAADFDKDGQSNYSEWLALTNPANSNSRFSVPNPMASGSDLVFPFPSFTGRVYRLRQHHGGGIWTYYPTPSITGTGSTREFTIPSSAGRGIFDVEVSLP